MRVFAAVLLAFVVMQGVHAKGHSSNSGPKTQYVQAYDKADGTHVSGYWRSPGQHAAGAYGGSNGGGAPSDDSGWAYGMGKQLSDDPKNARCVYKDVMTDEDLAACKRH